MKKKLFIFSLFIFFPLMAGSVPPSQKRGETFINLVSRLVEGDYSAASKSLKKLKRMTSVLKEDSARFIIGYADYKLGNYKSAVDNFSKIKSDLDPIHDYLLYFKGVSCLKIKDTLCAVTSLEEVINKYSNSILVGRSKWNLAKSYYELGNFDKAVYISNDIKPKENLSFTETDYNLFLARLYRSEEDIQRAVKQFQSIYFDAESDGSMQESVDGLKEIDNSLSKSVLKEMKSFPSQLRVVDQMLRNYRYNDAIDLMEKLYQERRNLHTKEQLADTYFKAREYKKAKKLYQELIEKRGKRGSLHYLLRLAKASARSDDFKMAIDTYKEVMNITSKRRYLYNYKLGFLYMDSNKYKEAIEYFSKVIKGNYRGHLRQNIIWNLAWCNYKLGNFEEAINYFKMRLGNWRDKEWSMRSAYWIAKSYDKLDKISEAKTLYRELIKKDRFGYYGFKSNEKLYRKIEIPEEWLIRQKTDFPSKWDINLLPSGLNKAKYLYNIGLDNLARYEVMNFNISEIQGTREAISFMEFARNVGCYREAYILAVRQFKDILKKYPTYSDFRKVVWRTWYPRAFATSVMKYTNHHNLDSIIPFSVMREESRFQSDVVSRAGAIGLMQIIPPTARKLARSVGLKDFEIDDLYEPMTNIRLGVKYLSDLSDLFNGEKVYMIASYNAGEDAVQRWIKNSDAKEMEEFIEEIPYGETNKYVKRVLKTYWMYKELY